MIIIVIIFMIANIAKLNAQATDAAPGTGNLYAGYKFLGWGTTSGDLLFQTNNFQRMVLQDNTGLFGIGLNFTPNNKLDVDSGDIDVNQPVNCYMIGDSAVLHYRGDATYTVPKVSNIFVGVGAGSITQLEILM